MRIIENCLQSLYFHFEFFSGANANEITHDHSPVVILVLEPKYEFLHKAYDYIVRQCSFK